MIASEGPSADPTTIFFSAERGMAKECPSAKNMMNEKTSNQTERLRLSNSGLSFFTCTLTTKEVIVAKRAFTSTMPVPGINNLLSSVSPV